MKIAIISPSLAQGGSERFVYEHAVAFKKLGHDCVIITRSAQHEYYASQLERVGIRVLKRLRRRIVFSRLGWSGLNRFMHSVYSFLDYLKVAPRQYDVILINQIEAYVFLRAYRPLVQNAVVLLMSHKFQYPHDPYAGLTERMRVYVMDEKQRRELIESGVGFDYVQYSLPLDLKKLGSVEYSRKNARLAYFARLSPERPIEFIFFALHVLRKRKPDVVLHIFGRGQLSFEQGRMVKILGLEESIVFEGHASSIPDAIREKEISAVWLTCDGNTLGYASIEMMAYRVPLVLWNLDPSVIPENYLADHDLERFVDRTLQILTDPGFALREVDRNYRYVSICCDVSKNAPRLLEFAAQTQQGAEL